MKETQKWILGMDIGTASCAAAAYRCRLGSGGKPEPTELAHLDGVIFSEPLHNPSGGGWETRNAERRRRRLQRRQISRRAGLRKTLLHIAKTLGLDETKLKDHGKFSRSIHQLRVEALDRRVEPYQLFRVLLHLAQNRGAAYLQEEGQINEAVRGKTTIGQYLLDRKREACSKTSSGGESGTDSRDQSKRIGLHAYKRWRKLQDSAEEDQKLKAEDLFYARFKFEDELKRILHEQSKHHAFLKEIYPYPDRIAGVIMRLGAADSVSDSASDKEEGEKTEASDGAPAAPAASEDEIPPSYADVLYHTLAYQRPIKWDVETIGDCDLYGKGYKAVPVCHPLFQRFRLEQRLQDLEWVPVGGEIDSKIPGKLSREEKNKLRKALLPQSEVPFKKMYELLECSSQAWRFSHDRRHKSGNEKEGLQGDKTSAAMREKAAGWDELSEAEQGLAMVALGNMSDLKTLREQKRPDLLKMLENFSELEPDTQSGKQPGGQSDGQSDGRGLDCEKVADFLTNLGRAKGGKKGGVYQSLAELGLEKGRSSYCATACRRLVEIMQEEDCDKAGAEVALREKLKEEGRVVINEMGEVRNPIVKSSLKIAEKLYRHMVSVMGSHPAQVRLEYMRELHDSAASRGEREMDMRKKEKERRDARKELDGYDGVEPTDANIARYRFWKEQDHKCAYTGRYIPLEKLQATEIDHIIPRAKGGSNGVSNKVLAFGDVNRKKGNRTPYGAMSEGFLSERDWTHIKSYAENLEKKAKEAKGKGPTDYYSRKARALLTQEKTEIRSSDKAMERRFTETSFIARLIGQELKKWSKGSLRDADILPVRGVLTDYLRTQWKMNLILPEIRHREGRPLLKKEREGVSEGVFLTLEEIKEQARASKDHRNKSREFDKRVDHRHHLVDAAVVGLVSRSMLKGASDHHRDNSRNASGNSPLEGFEVSPPVVVASLPEILRQKLEGHVVWHKPDRFGDGQLFKDNFYGLASDGQGLIQRKTLDSLKGKGGSYASLKREIEKKLVGQALKASLLRQLEEKEAADMKVDDAVKNLYYPEGSRNRVQKVRCLYHERGQVFFSEERDFALREHHGDLKDASPPRVIAVRRNSGHSHAEWDSDGTIRVVSRKEYAERKQKDAGYLKNAQNCVFPGDFVYVASREAIYQVASFTVFATGKLEIRLKLANETAGYGELNAKLSPAFNTFKKRFPDEKKAVLYCNLGKWKGAELLATRSQLAHKVMQLRPPKEPLSGGSP